MDIVYKIVIPLVTAAIAWFFSKLQTTREQKQTDLKLIGDAVTPLLNSIKNLTDHNNALIKDLLEEQKTKVQLMDDVSTLKSERNTLSEKVDSLEKTIKCLTRKIDKLANEKDTTVTTT